MTKGRFGIHGGQYMPETLMNAVIELEEAYDRYKDDPEFKAERNKHTEPYRRFYDEAVEALEFYNAVMELNRRADEMEHETKAG